MRVPIIAPSRSVTFKVGIIVFLIMLLLIPASMIKNVISDRKANASVAVRDISHSWGGAQIVTGPILRLPYKAAKITVYGSPFEQPGVLHILSDQLAIEANAKSEIRYRGIHEVPVYGATIAMQGSFDLTLLERLGIATEDVDWSAADLLLGVSDSKAISRIPVVNSGGRSAKFAAVSDQVAGLPPQLSAAIGEQKGVVGSESELAFDISLLVNGTGSLQFMPLAESATVSMESTWPSPSFTGRQLPHTREVREDGFTATWRSSSLGRDLPAHWTAAEASQSDVSNSVFGVRLIRPVGLYQLMSRAIKYAVLFIGLTFVTYFLIEVTGKLRLHPLQYLLVGLANLIFYLLLLSLAEHIGFDVAYVISAFASAALITGYSAAILVQRIRVIIMSGVLAGLYLFLYLTLTAETYALLAGSIGLWVVLAGIMYLTRGINWYESVDDDQGQECMT